jgi:arginyl-tRNA synthetase
MKMKQKIAYILSEKLEILTNVKIGGEEIAGKIEMPQNKNFGDFAFPCFGIAKEISTNPHSLALELQKTILEDNNKLFERIEVVGLYLNFFVNKVYFAKEVLKSPEKKGVYAKLGAHKKFVIEFPSPNTNKPLHLGHLRNMAIGESIARILESGGNKVFRVNLFNDRGTHICKSMLAYQKFGQNKKPDKKPDHFVGDFYVMFNNLAKENDSYDKEAQEMLVKWENGDKKTMALWNKMNKWAYQGFEQTFKAFGIKHNKYYYESKIYEQAKEFVLENVKSGIFSKRSDGAIIIDLANDGFDEKVLLRPDGTTIYMTQDLYLARLKDKDYNPDNSIYIVGNEQDYHFKLLFAILKKIGFKKCLTHLSYGMIELPEGKMKSREGNVIDADNFIETIKQMAKDQTASRYNDVDKDELTNRGTKIALAAIKYVLLKSSIFKNITFNPKESISFDGNTGPYLLYSYARAFSILKKVGDSYAKVDVKKINENEYELIKKINDFPDILNAAINELNPTVVAHYSYELAQVFNEFYHTCPVIDSDNIDVRIKIIKMFLTTLKKSLYLLGIDTLEKM